jgi:hypothetical protein
MSKTDSDVGSFGASIEQNIYFGILKTTTVTTSNLNFTNGRVAISTFDVSYYDASNNIYAPGYVYGQGASAVAVGSNAGINNQGANAVAIGPFCGYNQQGNNSVAVGFYASYDREKSNSTSIGVNAGCYSQGSQSVAVGTSSAMYNQGNDCVAIGTFSGFSDQSSNSVSIGTNSAQFNQGANSVAIGTEAGYSNQSSNSVAIGYRAGYQNQGFESVAVGIFSGYQNQGNNSVAVGYNSGFQNQGANSVAIGRNSGLYSQGSNSVVVGYGSGADQSSNCVALGYLTAITKQGANAVAIGTFASQSNQGDNSVAIGIGSGGFNQHSNTIAISSVFGQLPTSFPNSCYINNIRNASASYGVLQYDTSSKEIFVNRDKTFVLQHPEKEDKYLVHACLEGPENGVFYRGVAKIDSSKVVDVKLPSYTKHFSDFDVFVTPVFDETNTLLEELDKRVVVSEVVDGCFKIIGSMEMEVNYVVFGKRSDIECEPLISSHKVKNNGPYAYFIN